MSREWTTWLSEGVRRARRALASRTAAEWKIFGAAVVVVLGIWSLAALTDEVLEGETTTFDTFVLESLRNPDNPDEPLGPKWAQVAMRDITALGDVLIIGLIVFLVAAYLLLERKWAAAALIVVAVVTGQILVSSLKIAISRDRPDIIPHLVEVSTASFPSGHSSMSAVAYLTLGAMLTRVARRRRTKWFVLGVAALMTILIGLSRIYLGVHFPTDVLGGWIVGASWATLWWFVLLTVRRLSESRSSEPESNERPAAPAESL
ncbi:MAG: phosphatase PAP2 family protein [Planctomycetota bacterium]|nr:phosphatase PAP2 family protein [Planctomycetota bacterium]